MQMPQDEGPTTVLSSPASLSATALHALETGSSECPVQPGSECRSTGFQVPGPDRVPSARPNRFRGRADRMPVRAPTGSECAPDRIAVHGPTGSSAESNRVPSGGKNLGATKFLRIGPPKCLEKSGGSKFLEIWPPKCLENLGDSKVC